MNLLEGWVECWIKRWGILNISMKAIDFLEVVSLTTEGHLFPLADITTWSRVGAANTSKETLALSEN